MALFVALTGGLGLTTSTGLGASSLSHARTGHVSRVVLVGHGDGQGIGMGQWGAFGYAVRYHFSYQRILSHFYSHTVASNLTDLGEADDPVISVLILENLDLSNNVGYDPIVTSPSAFSITSSTGTSATPSTTSPSTTVPVGSTTLLSPTQQSSVPTTMPGTTSGAAIVTVPAGAAIDFRLQKSGTWNAYEASSCGAAREAPTTSAPIASGLTDPIALPSSSSPTASSTALLSLCRHDGVDEVVRGDIEAYDRSGYERTINLLPLQSYLQGVVPAEMSASWGLDGTKVGAPQNEPWGFQALEAQAVAARSYVLSYAAAGGWNGYADVCDTTECQDYVGANFEYPISNASVSDTEGEIRTELSSPSTIVETAYSASSGGWTAPSDFAGVKDLGDACVTPGVALECNPTHTWTVSIPAKALDERFKAIGQVLGLRVTRRNHKGAFGGRVITLHLVGTRAQMSMSGTAFAEDLGLYSDWFAVAKIVTTGTLPPPSSAPTSTTVPLPPTSSTTVPTTTVPTTTVPTTTVPTTTVPTTTVPTTTVP